MTDVPEAGEPPLWKPVLSWMASGYLTSEPSRRDRQRIDETLAELYALGERPTPQEVRAHLAEVDADEEWTREVAGRWRQRLKSPTWRPRGHHAAWVRPFYVPGEVIAEHGLPSISDRLAAALAATASDYMRKSEVEPASAATSTEAAAFALTAGAVRLWALAQDLIEGASAPSVLSFASGRKINLEHWTNAGQARHRKWIERLRERYEAEHPPQPE